MLVLVAALTLGAAACTNDGDGGDAGGTPGAGHTHGADGVSVSLPVGDGTRAEEVGYRLTDVTLPRRPGVTGEVAFTIASYRGEPVTDYLVEQTKELHLYVVREDLAVFRHVHPTRDARGRWSAPLVLPEAGAYRVVAEFVAVGQGGNGEHVVLGETVRVPGAWQRRDVPDSPNGEDGAVRVDVPEPGTAGPDQRLYVEVSDRRGRPLELGSYLGTSAHLTGFHTGTGAAVHLHPLGAPEPREDGTRLTFHTEFERPGTYRLFVQVRVDGFLHTVPVTVEVGRRPRTTA